MITLKTEEQIFQGNEANLCDTVVVDTYHYCTLLKPKVCTTTRMNPELNYGPS